MVNNWDFSNQEEKYLGVMASIRYAKRIQDALLINRKELKSIFGDFSIVYRPKDVVSGDFYYAKVKNDKKYLVVGDCTGHGVPGAFMSILCNDFILRAFQDEDLPHEIINHVDKALKERFFTEEENLQIYDGMDVSIAMIDYENQTVTFSGANQCGIFMTQNNGIHILKGNRKSVSSFSPSKFDFGFTSQVVPFEKGDFLYLFTDGYRDQFNEEKKKMGCKHFFDLLSSIKSQPILHQQFLLNQHFDDFKKGMFQIDDVLVLGIEL